MNKVATTVQLRFDVRGSPSLKEGVRKRLCRIAGKRMTAEGVLIIRAGRFRTQEANRKDALDRLAGLIRKAEQPPKKRIATRPSRAARHRRLHAKKQRSRIKQMRGSVGPAEE